MTNEAIVPGLCVESVSVGKVVLVSAPELGTSEVISSVAPGETVIAETAELASVPRLVVMENVVSDS